MISPLRAGKMTGTEDNQRIMEVSMVNKGPSSSAGTLTEKGSGGMVETGKRGGIKERKGSEQEKVAMERKWEEILRVSRELERREEKGKKRKKKKKIKC